MWVLTFLNYTYPVSDRVGLHIREAYCVLFRPVTMWCLDIMTLPARLGAMGTWTWPGPLTVGCGWLRKPLLAAGGQPQRNTQRVWTQEGKRDLFSPQHHASQGSLFSFHYGVCMETHLKNDSSNPISCLRQFYRSGPICFVQRWPSESHGTVFPGMNLEPTTTEQWKEGFLLSFSLGRQLCFQWLQSNDVLQPESRRYRCPISSNSHGSYYPFPFSFGW